MGADAAWLDMNDPSTGPVDCNAMLFQDGKAPHHAYHNQYASLMAEATRRGFLQARPDKRPFLISRSGFTGGQKHSAHWTGDNWSNYHHLHMSIGKTLNLALSGMPFNGGDVPGFGGNCKRSPLHGLVQGRLPFPFFRNHCMRTSKRQEPWVFSKDAMAIARRFVRLRYKLLPYLYNLFIRRRPKPAKPSCGRCSTTSRTTRKLPLVPRQRSIHGRSLRSCRRPFTVDGLAEREVALPDARWWRADKPGWVEGPARFQAGKHAASTPLFLREGALLPMLAGTPTTTARICSTSSC